MKLIRGYVIEVQKFDWNTTKQNNKYFVFLPADDFGIFKHQMINSNEFKNINPLVFYKYNEGVADVWSIKSSIPKSYELDSDKVKYYGLSINILNISHTPLEEITEELNNAGTQTE